MSFLEQVQESSPTERYKRLEIKINSRIKEIEIQKQAGSPIFFNEITMTFITRLVNTKLSLNLLPFYSTNKLTIRVDLLKCETTIIRKSSLVH